MILRLVHCNGKSGRESLSRKLHLEKISLAIFILGYDFLPLENELVNCFFITGPADSYSFYLF